MVCQGSTLVLQVGGGGGGAFCHRNLTLTQERECVTSLGRRRRKTQKEQGSFYLYSSHDNQQPGHPTRQHFPASFAVKHGYLIPLLTKYEVMHSSSSSTPQIPPMHDPLSLATSASWMPIPRVTRKPHMKDGRAFVSLGP